jgi:hypothetical protein
MYYRDLIAQIYLEPRWSDDKPTITAIKSCAFHEVLHILLADLTNAAITKCIKKFTVDGLEHSVIHTLENYVYKK